MQISNDRARLAGLMVCGLVFGSSFVYACPSGEDGQPTLITTPPYRGVVDGGGSGFEGQGDEQVADAELLTALDLAHMLMRGQMPVSGVGHYSADMIRDEVISAYELHLGEMPEDWYSMREYALALLWDHRYEEGFKALMSSYRGGAGLGLVKLNAQIFGGGSELKELTARLVRYAKVNDSANAWCMVAVILQGRDLKVHAQTNLDRALQAGLDAGVYDSISGGLAKMSVDASTP